MRQGQQQRRGRNRNNNRKGQNPLTRNFESSGPDVKIRGTPAHVAEKYMSLARDALSSGDPVLAENYLQHAEHYNRIILAYRETQNQPGESSGNQRNRQEAAAASDAPEEAAAEEAATEDAERVVQPGEPQPTVEEAAEAPAPARAERSEGRQRRSRSNGNGQQREGRQRGESRRREPRQRFGDSDQQPDFLRRPVRRSRSSEDAETEVANGKGSEPVEVASEQQD
ncbi:MAG: DUF4167 domain-containing protein [Filomicrobium sp.]